MLQMINNSYLIGLILLLPFAIVIGIYIVASG